MLILWLVLIMKYLNAIPAERAISVHCHHSAIHAISVCWQRQSFWSPAPWNFFWKNYKMNEFFWDKENVDICDDNAISIHGQRHSCRQHPLTAPSASADSIDHAISSHWQRHSRHQRRLTAPSASADSAIHTISVCWQRYPHHQHLLTVASASADSAIHAISVCWQRQSCLT